MVFFLTGLSAKLPCQSFQRLLIQIDIHCIQKEYSVLQPISLRISNSLNKINFNNDTLSMNFNLKPLCKNKQKPDKCVFYCQGSLFCSVSSFLLLLLLLVFIFYKHLWGYPRKEINNILFFFFLNSQIRITESCQFNITSTSLWGWHKKPLQVSVFICCALNY